METEHFPTCGRAAGEKLGRSTEGGRIRDLFAGSARVRHCAPGSTIFLQGDRVGSLYRIVAGTVRCCSFTEDGKRQIFRFAESDDLLGPTELDRWHFTAEAVDHVILRSIGREAFERALATDPAVQRALRETSAGELARRERQLLAMAYLPADERLLAFLAEYAERHVSRGFTVLPMTRLDIGDHLGLKLETISRGFGNLRRRGLIEMKGASRFRMVHADNRLAA